MEELWRLSRHFNTLFLCDIIIIAKSGGCIVSAFFMRSADSRRKASGCAQRLVFRGGSTPPLRRKDVPTSEKTAALHAACRDGKRA